MFCPKCGSLLIPKKENTKRVLACSCGYKSTDTGSVKISDKSAEHKEVQVVDRDIETDPITEATCPKCNNIKAYFWTVQTRAGDEPETKFLKCTKCKHTWRDYD